MSMKKHLISLGFSTAEMLSTLMLLLALNILGSNPYIVTFLIVLITADAVLFYWGRIGLDEKLNMTEETKPTKDMAKMTNA